MNYRHAYHAGNFADCMKHAVLVALIAALQRKPKPFLLLDTHAGAGSYDLAGDAATRTGEWRKGIGKLLDARPAALADYLAVVDRLGLYPGSPAIAAALLRPADRLLACELLPADAQLLRAGLAGAANVAVHERDGYAALPAFLPPPEKRALVLIDPPFEQPAEFAVLAEHLAIAWAKFKAGVLVVWYPIKHLAPVRNFTAGIRLAQIRDVITLELWLRPPLDPTRLNGCGLLLVNPPYGFAEAAAPMLQAMVDVCGEAGAGFAIERVTDE